MTTALWILAAILVVLGIAGTILPALPGTVLVFTGLVVAAWADDFTQVGWIAISVLGALTLLSIVCDLAASAAGASRVGASRAAVTGAAAGTLIGAFFGIAGLIVGPLAGAVIGELTAGTGIRRAGKVGLGAWLGFVVGTLLKIALAFAMVGVFIIAYLF